VEAAEDAEPSPTPECTVNGEDMGEMPEATPVKPDVIKTRSGRRVRRPIRLIEEV